MKEYDTQNSSITQESNRLTLTYLPQFIIYEDYDRFTEIFYAQQDKQAVKLKTNIDYSINFTYYCLFGDSNQYLSQPIFENGHLTQCPLPYIVEPLVNIKLKL